MSRSDQLSKAQWELIKSSHKHGDYGVKNKVFMYGVSSTAIQILAKKSFITQHYDIIDSKHREPNKNDGWKIS